MTTPAIVLTAGVGLLLLYAVVIAAIAHHFTRARPQQPRIMSPQLHDTCEHVAVVARDDAFQLRASVAHAPNGHGAVVLVHGRGTCRGNELRANSFALVEALNRCGLTVLLLDLRGHGDSAPARVTYGIREQRDVLGAYDWLVQQGYSPGRIGVLGASMGGAASIVAAAREPGFGAVVLDSAFVDVAQLFDLQFVRFTRLPRVCLASALAVGRVLTGEWISRFRPLDYASSLRTRPTLVIHAEGDSVVPMSHARDLVAASGAELWTTQGRGHLRSYGHDGDAYRERVTAFFVQHLIEADPGPRHRDGVRRHRQAQLSSAT